jgi:hypothetical protein
VAHSLLSSLGWAERLPLLAGDNNWQRRPPYELIGQRVDNAAMENFLSSPKNEHTGPKRTDERGEGIVRLLRVPFSNAKRRHSTIGYLSPMTASGDPVGAQQWASLVRKPKTAD